MRFPYKNSQIRSTNVDEQKNKNIYLYAIKDAINDQGSWFYC